jgi:hypothetical protein
MILLCDTTQFFIVFSYRIAEILTADVYIYFLDLFHIVMNMKIVSYFIVIYSCSTSFLPTTGIMLSGRRGKQYV